MSQISAKIIADSVHETRITTMELEYPRFIHGEFMTHRVFSRNAASSRAIPMKNVIKQVLFNPAMPIHWGKNQRGMQAKTELGFVRRTLAKLLWRVTGIFAAFFAFILYLLGLHKQVGNRILEPWQMMKVVVTSTTYDNFFLLRDHPAAQPEIRALAVEMRRALDESQPTQLKRGQWHLPYVSAADLKRYGLEDCKKISASCCAQTSYRKLDATMEKALYVYERLVSDDVLHASPFEHQARAISGNVKSGNFKGWRQNRQDIEEQFYVRKTNDRPSVS
jgi:hypothetical protein